VSLGVLQLHAAEPAAPERVASTELGNFVRPLKGAHSPAWPFLLRLCRRIERGLHAVQPAQWLLNMGCLKEYQL